MRNKYQRVCSCGNVSLLTHKPVEGQQCRNCAKDKNKTGPKKKDPKDLKRYTHVCEECQRVRVSLAKPKGPLCGACSSRKTGKANKGKERIMRYIRICPECPEDSNTREVTVKANSGIKLCKKHKIVPQGEDRKQVKTYKARTKQVKLASKGGIKAAQELNRKHKEAVANITKEKPIPQKKTDAEMLKEFFEHSKPSIEFSYDKIPYATSKTGSCSSTSVLGA